VAGVDVGGAGDVRIADGAGGRLGRGGTGADGGSDRRRRDYDSESLVRAAHFRDPPGVDG
jgi:hypothetical protein